MNSAWTILNSTWTVLNSTWTVNPCEVTVHAQKKKKKTQTWGNAQCKRSLCIRLVTEKMCFLWYFQEHNQTSENIFRNIFWNATKHMKTFSFPKNSISKKYLFSENTFTQTPKLHFCVGRFTLHSYRLGVFLYYFIYLNSK